VPDLRTHALIYHDVVRTDRDASGFSGPGPRRYTLPWARFVEHLDRIDEAVGGPPDIVDDLLTGRPGSPSWLLTFDDGGSSAADVGEELTRRRWRGHFFVITGLIGNAGFLDVSEIRDLHRMGHVIGSHSVTHPGRMSSLSFEQVLHEWHASVAALSDLVGEDVRTACVPGGYYNEQIAVAADRSGIAALFTSEPVRTVRRVGGCLVIGRYSVRRNSSAGDAARAAAGQVLPWLRQYCAWNLRRPLKAIGGDHYVRARRALLATWERRAS
jgi:peptidoglycan/xylan/chitin deacetylase (PgdA/CDA1 family)